MSATYCGTLWGVPTIRITVDGKLALTVEQATDRYGLSEPSAMRTVLARLKQAGNPAGTPVAYLDGRKPLYSAAALDRAMKRRPGRGAPGVPRPRDLPPETPAEPPRHGRVVRPTRSSPPPATPRTPPPPVGPRTPPPPIGPA